MKTTVIGFKKSSRNLIFFFVLLSALLISLLARAEEVTLAWNANTEADLAGYQIHYGTSSGTYTISLDVHNVTTYTVTGLSAGQTYFFAASAYNASGLQSGYSNEVSHAISNKTQININAAPKEVLMAIAGITPEIADSIIGFREQDEIKNKADVGIPPESEKYITLGDSQTYTIDSSGIKGYTKTGLNIRATVRIEEGGNNYRYLYYKSPA